MGRCGGPSGRAVAGGILGAAVAAGAAACELQEVALTEPEDVLVAEILARVRPQGASLTALLHGTLTAGGGDPGALEVADVRALLPEGVTVTLEPHPLGRCVAGSVPPEVRGACFRSDAVPLGPGDSLDVRVVLPDGRALEGGATVPGPFELRRPAGTTTCALRPGTSLEVVWSPAPGAWAYLAETLIAGLAEALEPLGIPVDEDPLLLLGLSVSATDTTIALPREFGVFDRFELDRELALILQEGLPPGTVAEVAVAAVDRNYVNWVRGGDFNPSGQVRVPSLRGDGTGFVGAMVERAFEVRSGDPASLGMPECGPPPPGAPPAASAARPAAAAGDVARDS